MTDAEYLISYLAEKQNIEVSLPDSDAEREKLFFSLSENFFPDTEEDEFFLTVQDRFLQAVQKARRPVSVHSLTPVENNLYVWKGDPTRLEIDAVVSCTDEYLMGCYIPCHECITKRIYKYAGAEIHTVLRRAADFTSTKTDVSAIITKAHNLPSRFIIHPWKDSDAAYPYPAYDEQLSAALQGRLHLAWLNNISSACLCCAFSYAPDPESAAKELVASVRDWMNENPDYKMRIVLCVLNEDDRKILMKALSE